MTIGTLKLVCIDVRESNECIPLFWAQIHIVYSYDPLAQLGKGPTYPTVMPCSHHSLLLTPSAAADLCPRD
jgi:hypothetical protein